MTFLTHLAVTENVVASSQNQVLNAIPFLYREEKRSPLDPNAHRRVFRIEQPCV